MGDIRATSCWEGVGMPQGAPGQPQSAAPLPGAMHFPSQLGQFLPPAVEQVLRRAVLHHCPQSRTAPHHSQCHSIPFPSPPYSPIAAPLATGAGLGRKKGKGCLHFPTSGGSLHLRRHRFRAASAAQSHSWHPEPWDLAWGHPQCVMQRDVCSCSAAPVPTSQSSPPLRGGRRTRRVS